MAHAALAKRAVMDMMIVFANTMKLNVSLDKKQGCDQHPLEASEEIEAKISPGVQCAGAISNPGQNLGTELWNIEDAPKLGTEE